MSGSDPGAATGEAASAALAFFRDSAASITELQIELCEIGAPSGGEQERAQAVERWLRTSGCKTRRDGAGNVIAERPGTHGGPGVALSAHLDSVFLRDQDVTVFRSGQVSPYREGEPVPEGELHAPGIADDAAGLAALIAVAQALSVADVRTRRDLLFVATVGEEGRGDLKGARYFFSRPPGRQLQAFITLDHPDPHVIAHRGVGSRRFEVEFRGPGGHSWGHFGRYNPALAMAAAGERIGAITVPRRRRRTYNIGVMEAGPSITAIPQRARMEVDLRSDRDADLNVLEGAFRRAVAEGHAEELARRPSPEAGVTIVPIGERPSGETPKDAPLVLAAQRALRAEGFRPRLMSSSSDANAAMAAGVPAICVSWGGRSGDHHSVREFFAPAERERSLRAILRLVLDVAKTDP